MSVRWLTFVLWAALAASGVAWALKLFVTPMPAPREARVADAGTALRGDVTRVLGVDAPPPAAEAAASEPVADARFQLVGVVAPRSRHPVREGVALIAVDGKPARAYRVGAPVDEGTVLKAVRARGADLGPREGAPTIALEVPPLPPAATGTLPAATSAPAVSTTRPRPGMPAPPSRVPAVAPPPPVMPAAPSSVALPTAEADDETPPRTTAPGTAARR